VVADRPHQLRRLLSKAQEALAAELLLGSTGWSSSTRSMPGSGKAPGAELWELDDGLRFLELSIRVDADANAVDAKQRFEDSVRNRGLTIDAKQGTKTSTVLERLVKVAAKCR
jgi:hypothetical protein